MTDFYFAYGSNLNPERMRARGLAFTRHEAARLPSYALCFNKRAHNKTGIAYANITYAPESIVEGVLYQLAGDIEVMDPFEGTPVRYSRELFPVAAAESVIWAWVYVANPAYIASELHVEENYLNHLLSAGDLLSAAYREHLAGLAPVVASDAPADHNTGLRFNV